VDGKVDWMAANLPVEGEDGPFIGQQVSPVPTCDVGGRVEDARRAMEEAGEDTMVVVAGDGLAVGEIEADELQGRTDDEPLLDVMSPVPSTYRPSVTVEALAEDGGEGRHLVTTSDGRLLGAVTIEASEDHHDHDHGDHEQFEKDLSELMGAIEERFGDREPSEDELRSFLRQRLVSEGRSEEDADRFLDELKTD
jgi:CBS domain-containing protein